MKFHQLETKRKTFFCIGKYQFRNPREDKLPQPLPTPMIAGFGHHLKFTMSVSTLVEPDTIL